MIRPVSWRELTASLLFFALIFAWFSWPLAASFDTAFIGRSGNDANQYVWNAYNFRQAVAAGTNPFYTELLLYPRGASLVMHTYTPLIGLLNVLLRHEILAVNVALLLSFVLSGMGAYRLARRWVASPVLAALVGFAYAFSPYKLAHLPDHYHLLLTAPVPFYIHAFLESFTFQDGRFWPRVRRWGQVGLCVALGLFTLLSDYYTLFGLLYFSLGYALFFWLRPDQIRWRRWQTWAVLAGVLVAGHLVSRGLKLAEVPDRHGFWWGGDVAGYLLPPPHSRWLSSAFINQLLDSRIFNMPGSVENTMFLGYVLPLLGLWWALRLRQAPLLVTSAVSRQASPLPWLLLLFVLLTLPELRVFGKGLLRLPTGLLHYVPFFNNIRCPTRHVAYVSLLLPLVAVAGLDTWLRNRLRPTAQWAVGSALLAVMVLEYQPQAQPLLRATDMPAAYRIAAALPGETLFSVPFGLLDGYQQQGHMNGNDLFYQTLHHKKLLGAYISRIPQPVFDEFSQTPILRELLLLQDHPDTTLAVPPRATTELFLRTYQPAAFVISPAYQNSAIHHYLRGMLLPLGYHEEAVAGYRLLRR